MASAWKPVEKITPKKVKDFMERHKQKDYVKNKKILEEQELQQFWKELEILKIERERQDFGKKMSKQQKQNFLNRMCKDIQERRETREKMVENKSFWEDEEI